MKFFNSHALAMIIGICLISACASKRSYDQSVDTNVLTLLSDSPDSIPIVFAPGILSTPKTREGAITFSPDMTEIYFTSVDGTGVLQIKQMQYANKSWTKPQTWEHSKIGNNSEPFISADGKALYFISNRHAPNEKGSGRIWMSSRVKGKWQEPQMMAWSVTTNKGLWFPSAMRDGTLFFGAYLDSIGNYGKSDLYVYLPKTRKIENVGSIINSSSEEWDPFIAADESYLLFESDRPGGYGSTDIYITFRKGDKWSEPINLGPNINTKDYEVAARVSPDGKYLFFDRPRKTEQDIHWVSAAVIDKLKRKFYNK
jgi:Tol biopolymer transport system component